MRLLSCCVLCRLFPTLFVSVLMTEDTDRHDAPRKPPPDALPCSGTMASGERLIQELEVKLIKIFSPQPLSGLRRLSC